MTTVESAPTGALNEALEWSLAQRSFLSQQGRARGKLEPERRAAPSPGELGAGRQRSPRAPEGRASFTAPVGATAVRREEGGASFTVPAGVSTSVRARGKLEPERRAAPSPATIP